MKKYWLTFSLAIVGLVLGWQLGLQRNGLTPISDTASASGLPDIYWANLEGGKNRLDEWQDKVLIVNHWATWCGPCRQEIPMFMAFRQEYSARGVELIGIAHDDEAAVRRYVDSMGMDYPQLLAGSSQGQKWLAELGNNGSLPFTLVFDREGILRAKKTGLMSRSELLKAVTAIL